MSMFFVTSGNRNDDSPPIGGSSVPAPATWVDHYGDYLYNFAYSRLRDQQAAEDAVQETLLAALKAISRFSGKSAFKTWLVGILKHKIIDHLRKQIREQPSDEMELLPAEKESVFDKGGKYAGHWSHDRGPTEWSNDPSKQIEQKEFWEVLDKCLNGLPPRFSGVFTLHQMEEMPAEEICKQLDITSTNLWVVLHRARKQLRRCMELNWFENVKFKGNGK